MAHWVQYHTPDRMGCGIDEAISDSEDEPDCYQFSVVSNKASDDPRGDIIWMVGITNETNSPVYLGWWFVVDDILPSDRPDFLFLYVGDEGGSCDPMPVISGERWYRQLLGMTGVPLELGMGFG